MELIETDPHVTAADEEPIDELLARYRDVRARYDAGETEFGIELTKLHSQLAKARSGGATGARARGNRA
jgi:hypothetical protein